MPPAALVSTTLLTPRRASSRIPNVTCCAGIAFIKMRAAREHDHFGVARCAR